MMWHTASLHYLAANSVRKEEVQNQRDVWQKKKKKLAKMKIKINKFLFFLFNWVKAGDI